MVDFDTNLVILGSSFLSPQLKEKLSKESKKAIEENTALENKLKNELKELESENQRLNDENNRLREEYWENREIYDYILASKSWKYTRWMRKD